MASSPTQQLVSQTLEHLRAEKRRCEAAILGVRAKLERLSAHAAPAALGQARSRSGWTQAKRQEVSRRMRAFWAARRAAAPSDDKAPSP